MKGKLNFVKDFVLLKDERILWEARPRKINFFEKPHTSFIIMCWVICLCIYAVAFKYWNYTSNIIIEDYVRNGTTIFLMAVGLITALYPYKMVRTLEKKVHYLVTDKRMIVYMQKSDDLAFVESRNLEDIKEVTFVDKGHEMGDLYIGPMTKEAVKNSRKTPPPVLKERDYLKTMVLYNFYQPMGAVKFFPPDVTIHIKDSFTEKSVKNNEADEDNEATAA